MITLKQFEMAVRATIEHGIKRSIKVLGPTGVGKSEVIHQIAASYGMNVIDIRLLLWSLTDLKGIPYPDEDKKYTKWLINDVLPRADRDGERGIIILEELNSAPKTVQAAAYQLTLDRRIGDYVLPDGWIIIATGNREQDNGVYVAPPAPLVDRFEIHEIQEDFQTWKDYAIKAAVNPAIISYLTTNQKSLYTFKTDDSAELVFATPRSWVAVSDLLNVGLTGDVLRIKVEGDVGKIEGTAFLKYYKNISKLPNIEAILKGRYIDDEAAYDFMSSVDVYYLLIQNFVHIIGQELRIEGDKLNQYIDNTADFICGVHAFPLELRQSYIDQICELNPSIKEYIFNKSRCQKVSKLLQELEYIK